MLRFQAFARVLTVVMFIATMSFPQTAVSEAVAKPDPSLEHIRQARKQAANRTRRIIFNNDGNDGRTSSDEPRTHENFLGKRTTALAGSQVDAIFYCTGLFNLYTHHSKESEPRVYREGNVVEWGWELGNQGPDSLETMVRFGHQHGMEVFWSMRMNDCHDSTMPRNLSQWKKDHPECLMGKKGVRFKAGGNRWSALNYAVPETRDKVLRILTDVATRYDVDGLELDFFRSPIYFLPQMHGRPVTREHCDMMTDLLRRVRRMADEQAARRGRPMLIAVRVPDSVEFARAMGLDLVRWLEEDLVDLMAVTCLFRLNPWETSVALGRKHGVPVYASLSESRLKDEEAKALRLTEPCYRGRALEAWAAGVDGIYTFNFFNPHSELWKELGDPEKLLAREHVYTTGHTTVHGANSWLANGTRFLNLPTPLPERPLTLKPGGSASVELRTGPPPPGSPQEGRPPHVRARLRFQKAPEDSAALRVELNGHALGAGKFSGGWLEYPVKPEWIRKGVNRFDLQLARSRDDKLVLQDLVLAVTPQRIERVEFHSTALGETRHFDIVLPEGFDRDAKEHPFLMLLHGRGRNSRSLLDDPSSRELFLDAGFVTLFPDGDNSWYLDSPANPTAKYASYLNELLELAEIRFGLSKKPERRALAGWSMGGYGCVRFAQTHPGRFGAVASIIGLLDYPRSEEAFPPGQSYPVRTECFGADPTVWEALNPMNWADRLAGASVLLITADRAFDRTMNERFSRRLSQLGIPHELKMLDGTHSISVVHAAVPLVIEHARSAFSAPKASETGATVNVATRRPRGPTSSRTPIYLNWDYNCLTLGPAGIADLVRDARDAGVNGINLRISNKGALNRRTGAGTCYNERLDAFGEDFDPLAALVAECHEQGLAAHVWIDLFEAAYDPLIEAHPEFSPRGRPGKPRLSGVPCYSHAEVRKHMLDLVDECAAYRPDAVFFCTKSSHVPKNQLNQPHNSDSGFNPPVARRYQELYGVDILTEPFDRKKMGLIRGEFLIDFLVEARHRLNRAGIPVIVGATVSGRLQPTGPNMHLDWRRILERKAADALLMANSRGEYHVFYSEKGKKTFAEVRRACDEAGVQFWPYVMSSGTHAPIAEKVGFAGLLDYLPKQIDYLAEMGGDAVLVHDLDLYTHDRNLRRALWKAAGRRQPRPERPQPSSDVPIPDAVAIVGGQKESIPRGHFEHDPDAFWFLQSSWILTPNTPLRSPSFEQHASDSRPVGWIPSTGRNPRLLTVYDWKVMHGDPYSGRTFFGRASLMLGAKPGAADGARTASWTAEIPVPRSVNGNQRISVQVHGETLGGIRAVGMKLDALDDKNQLLTSLDARAPSRGTFPWQPLELAWPADTRAKKLRLNLYLTVSDAQDTAGRVWFDDLKIEPVDPPDAESLTFPIADEGRPAFAGRRSARWTARPGWDLVSVPFRTAEKKSGATLKLAIRAERPMDVTIEWRKGLTHGKGPGSEDAIGGERVFTVNETWRVVEMPVGPGLSRLVFRSSDEGILWIDEIDLVE